MNVPKRMFDALLDLKSLLLRGGYNNLPKDFKKFLFDNEYDFDNVSNYNMVKLTILTLKYLIERSERNER